MKIVNLFTPCSEFYNFVKVRYNCLSMSIDIADYDKSDYNYIRFWQVRQYENQSEQQALAKLLPKAGESLIDLGGGFGRLAHLYSSRFASCVLLDYSQKNLEQAEILTQTAEISNLSVKQGNVYDLPFKNQEFDCALMIRVIHHLLKPEKALKETARILKPDGILILEFANKIHLKARIRAWLHFPTSSTSSTGILKTYDPKYIQQILENAGFVIEKKISVSHFRIPILKKLIPLSVLLFFEILLQRISLLSLSHFYLGPSIFLKCRKVSS